MIRTFVAIKIKPKVEFLEFHDQFKSLLRNEKIKWVGKDNFHLTLRFLGNTSQEQVRELDLGLAQIAEKLNSFNLSINGLGNFKSKGQPRVFFAKLDEAEQLQKLADEIESLAVSLGFEAEHKIFRPHLTLARIKHIQDKQQFYKIIEEYSERYFQIIEVKEFVFYQSVLTPDGPIYKPINYYQIK